MEELEPTPLANPNRDVSEGDTLYGRILLVTVLVAIPILALIFIPR